MKLHQLKEFVKQTIREEQDYQQLFKHMLDKTGKSIPDMSDDDKKKFFNAVDKAYKAKSEGKLTGYTEAELTAGQKKLDVDGDGEIEASDLAALRAGKKTDEATTSSAPGEWVAYLSMTRGKKLLNTFNTARGAKQFLSKNVDKLLGGANVESVGVMSKKQWDEREAKYAIESVNEGKKVFKVNPGIGKAKYSISSHDGKKTHKDGSDFYDI
jgi:L-alanine-DL-glutamate epimerase-like enolase superfamily enzyme